MPRGCFSAGLNNLSQKVNRQWHMIVYSTPVAAAAADNDDCIDRGYPRGDIRFDWDDMMSR